MNAQTSTLDKIDVTTLTNIECAALYALTLAFPETMQGASLGKIRDELFNRMNYSSASELINRMWAKMDEVFVMPAPIAECPQDATIENQKVKLYAPDCFVDTARYPSHVTIRFVREDANGTLTGFYFDGSEWFPVAQFSTDSYWVGYINMTIEMTPPMSE